MLTLSLAAAAATVDGTFVASSTYPKENGVSYSVANLADHRADTAWIEGARGSGLGSWVEVTLAAPTALRGLRVWNGNQASIDFYQRHNRLKDIDVAFSDGSHLALTLADSMAPQTLLFPKSVTTTSVRLKIQSVYDGTTFGDSPLSELQLLDTSPETLPTATASSTFPTDADASYEAAHLVDGLVDTTWCAKAGGPKEWVEVDLGAVQAVSRLRIVQVDPASSQLATATLRFDDGSTATVSATPTLEPQEIAFPSRSTRKVRVTVDSVVKGTSYDDLCLGEVGFLGP